MTRVLPLALLVVTGLVAAPAAKDKPVYYLPTKVGDTRVYETTERRRTTEAKEEVTKVESKDGVVRVSTVRTVNGRVMPARVTVVTEGALYSPGGPFGPPDGDMSQPVLKLPAKAGESWTHEPESPVPGGMKTTYTTGKQEEIEVPAGKFRAVVVEMAVVFGGKDNGKTTIWYAPGVGMVKSVNPNGTTVLKSFTPGK